MHCSVFVPWSPYWSESWKKWLDGINKPSLFLGLNCIFFFIDLVRPVCVSVHSSPTNQPQTKPIGLLSRLKLSGFCLFYIFFLPPLHWIFLVSLFFFTHLQNFSHWIFFLCHSFFFNFSLHCHVVGSVLLRLSLFVAFPYVLVFLLFYLLTFGLKVGTKTHKKQLKSSVIRRSQKKKYIDDN